MIEPLPQEALDAVDSLRRLMHERALRGRVVLAVDYAPGKPLAWRVWLEALGGRDGQAPVDPTL